MQDRRIRVLMAKPGLDGHDIGAKAVVFALRNAGMEVIYTGRHQTPVQIFQAVVQEDVDVLGLSILSGNHLLLCTEIMNMIKEQGLNDVLVVVGGNIPGKERKSLNDLGISGIFPASSSFSEIIDFIKNNVKTASIS